METALLVLAAAVVAAALLLRRRPAAEQAWQDLLTRTAAEAEATRGLQARVDQTAASVSELLGKFEERRRLEEAATDAVGRIERLVAGSWSKGRVGENLLAAALGEFPPDMVVRDFTLGGRVCEFALALPDGKLLPIDSKWPAVEMLTRLDGELDPGGREDLRARPLVERRARLEEELRESVEPIHITPHTRDRELAEDWFERFEGAGLDGLIAKRLDQSYLPGKRGWIKYKHSRTADCVVIGFRWSADRSTLGALLLGLYDDDGQLHYVGHTSSFSVGEKRELLKRLEPMREVKSTEHMGRAPGGLSRWSHGKDTDWEPIRPELVCEVSYDKLQAGQRFRHATGFIRWRPDKPAGECRFDQIVSAARFDVSAIFAGSR